MTLQHIDNPDTIQTDEMREFAQVMCRALLMICKYLNRRYCLGIRSLTDG